jgi:hypothetical protein
MVRDRNEPGPGKQKSNKSGKVQYLYKVLKYSGELPVEMSQKARSTGEKTRTKHVQHA